MLWSSLWLCGTALAATGVTEVTVGSGVNDDYDQLWKALAAGQTDILVLSGTRNGGGVVNVDGTTITGDPGATIVDGPGVQLEIRADGVTVKGLEFEVGDPALDRYAIAVNDAATVRLVDLVIHGGSTSDVHASGGIVIDNSDVTIEGGELRDNQGGNGGAMHIKNGSLVVVDDVDFRDNIADGNAGAIYSTASTLTVIGSTFDGNDGGIGYGGAIYAWHQDQLTVDDTEFTNNQASQGGAAIEADTVLTVDLAELTVQHSAAGLPVELYDVDTASLSGSTFSDNASGGLWGYNVAAFDITDTWFCGTSANPKSQVYLQSGCGLGCSIHDSVFVDGTSDSPLGGGGLSVDQAAGIELMDNLWVGNDATLGAAASLLLDNGSASLARLLIGQSTGSPALHLSGASDLTLDEIGTFNNTMGDGSGTLSANTYFFPVSPVLTADGNRCSTTPATLACSRANEVIWANGLGPEFDDQDDDGVPADCDCDDDDSTQAWAPCNPDLADGLPPTRVLGEAVQSTVDDVTGTPQGEPPATALDTSTWLSGGGGCGCIHAGPGSVPAGGMAALVGVLSRRHSGT